jgi:hypothetical protein
MACAHRVLLASCVVLLTGCSVLPAAFSGMPATMEDAVECWVRRDPAVNVQPPITTHLTHPLPDGQISFVSSMIVQQGKPVQMTALLFGRKVYSSWDISGGGAWETARSSATTPLSVYEAADSQGQNLAVAGTIAAPSAVQVAVSYHGGARDVVAVQNGRFVASCAGVQWTEKVEALDAQGVVLAEWTQ